MSRQNQLPYIKRHFSNQPLLHSSFPFRQAAPQVPFYNGSMPQTFNVQVGTTRTLTITPRAGELPGSLTSQIPIWTPSSPSLVVVPAPDGMSASINASSAGSFTLTVAYQSTENAFPLRQEQCTIVATVPPADNLLFTLI